MRKLVQTQDGYKHDWSQARITFIEGVPDAKNPDKVTYPNLREIAEMHKIPYQQVRAKAGKERWSEERATFQLDVAQKRRKSRALRLADESINFDDQSLSIAKIGQGLIAARFGEIAQELRVRQKPREAALKRMENGEFVDPIELRSAVWFKEISELASAAERIQTLGQRALGTDIEQIQISMEQNVQVGGEISVRTELQRNDPERLAQMLNILQRSKIPFLQKDEEGSILGLESIIDADVIEDDDDDDIEEDDTEDVETDEDADPGEDDEEPFGVDIPIPAEFLTEDAE